MLILSINFISTNDHYNDFKVYCYLFSLVYVSYR